MSLGCGTLSAKVPIAYFVEWMNGWIELSSGFGKSQTGKELVSFGLSGERGGKEVGRGEYR